MQKSSSPSEPPPSPSPGCSAGGDGVFRRTVDLLGVEGFEALRGAFVVVVGLGGVGSHAAASLARSGVGRLRLVDFDQLTLSSLNRHVHALPADAGRGKAEVLAEHISALNEGVTVEVTPAFFHEESADELLGDGPGFVIDAIDSFTPKVALLRTCVKRGINVISCMGASARTNPSLLRVGDISETRVCPLARVVRRALRKHEIFTGITTVYSIEAPVDPLPPDPEDQVLQRGRTRNRLPSLGFMPGIFGYAAAGIVITRLAGYLPGEAR